MTPTVYLAGPINGCTMEEGNHWRDSVSSALARYGIRGISPLRCEPLLVGERYGADTGGKVYGSREAIYTKNKMDVRMCDLVLAYIPRWSTERKPSYGTVTEIAWANSFGKPVILVSDDAIISTHPDIQMQVQQVGSLEIATQLIVDLLKGYVA